MASRSFVSAASECLRNVSRPHDFVNSVLNYEHCRLYSDVEMRIVNCTNSSTLPDDEIANRCTLESDSVSLNAIVLATWSPLLYRLLQETNPCSPSSTNSITIIIPESDRQTLRAIVDLLYSGLVARGNDDGQCVKQILDALQIQEGDGPLHFTKQRNTPSQHFDDGSFMKQEVEPRDSVEVSSSEEPIVNIEHGSHKVDIRSSESCPELNNMNGDSGAPVSLTNESVLDSFHSVKRRRMKNTSIRCKVCKLVSGSKRLLRAHTCEKHNRKRLAKGQPVSCDICQRMCRSSWYLQNHKARDHLKPLFRCHRCSTDYETASALNEHLKSENCHSRDSHSDEKYQSSSVADALMTESAKITAVENISPSPRLNGELTTSKNQSKCDVCSKSFRTAVLLSAHRKRMHDGGAVSLAGVAPDDASLLQCLDCGGRYATPVQLATHRKRIHGGQTHACDRCELTFKSRSKLSEHYQVHREVKRHPCNMCSASFSRTRDLVQHQKVQHLGIGFDCSKCGKRFKIEENLRQHVCGEALKPFACDVCQRRFTTNVALKRHTNVHTMEKVYNCSICSKTFYDVGSCKTHELAHRGLLSCVCDECGKTLSSKNNLKQHKAVAHAPDPSKAPRFPCSECGFTFNRRGDWKKHSLIHTGEKPFCCSICSKSFRLNSLLKSHILFHSDVKEHQCSFCQKRFYTKNSLRDHERTHTGEKPFRCKECDRNFSSSTLLSIHGRMHKRQS